MFNYFFHALPQESGGFPLNDIFPMLIIWAILIPITLWLVRLAYKSVRKTTMVQQNTEVYLCRDLFLSLSGFEYLLVVVILAAVYFGFWGYYTLPFSAAWLNWRTWVIILPQLSLLLTIIVLFFIRYTKFRKPYIK